MIRIKQLKLPVSHTEEELIRKIAKLLKIRPEAVQEYQIRKQSVDARRKHQVSYVYTLDVAVRKESAVLRREKSSQISQAGDISYEFPISGTEPLAHPPVIIGSGPAGLFCGWLLVWGTGVTTGVGTGVAAGLEEGTAVSCGFFPSSFFLIVTTVFPSFFVFFL